MSFWEYLKAGFKKKEVVVESVVLEEQKEYLKDNYGQEIKCELCQGFMEVNKKRTFMGKKCHIECLREARKQVKKQYGI